MDSYTGYALTFSGGINKTTNAGENWIYYYTGTPELSNSMYFVNENLGFICGTNGMIAKTTNGGVNWIFLTSGTDRHLNSILFTDVNTGYCAGDTGAILITSNQGANWTIRNPVTFNSLQSVYFANSTTGYICGERGIVLKTTNSGVNWVSQNSAVYNKLSSVLFINENTGFLVGQYGTILKTTNGGNPIGIQKPGTEIPEQFVLYQNYPNPFNPTTKIKFDIPLSRGVSEGRGVFTKLVIYDILGREITTIVNEQLQPGTYEVEWDASNYPSGVYFYKLIVTDASTPLSISKKMVLLK